MALGGGGCGGGGGETNYLHTGKRPGWETLNGLYKTTQLKRGITGT